MSTYITMNRTVSLEAAGRPEFLQGTLYAGENQAHRFVIQAMEDGEKRALSGSVTALFIRPDQETVVMTGEIVGGCAVATLAQSCYTQTGRFMLTIFLIEGEVKTAIYSVTGNVRKTTTDTIVDPGHVIPDINDILAEYAAMQQAVEGCEEAAEAANTAASVVAGLVADVSDNQIIVETESAAIAHVEDAARVRLKVLEVEIKAVQAGSGDPSPTNIRQISGWTSVGVTRCGKNLVSGIDSITVPMASQVVLDFGRDVTIDIAITFVCNSVIYTNATGSIIDLRKADGTHNYKVPGAFGMTTNTANTGAFTYQQTGVTLQKVVLQNNCNFSSGTLSMQVEARATPTAYEAYSGAVAQYALPTEAGTVYGGKLRINEDGSGLLTVTHKLLDPSKFARNSANADGDGSVFYAGWQQTGAQGAEGAFITNYLTPYTPATVAYDLLPVNTIRHYGTNSTILICCPGASTTKAQMLEWYQENGIQILYPLREDSQTTYALTAQQVLSLIKGTNNVYADTGDTAIEYVADTKTYIDNKFAELQALVLENTGETGPGAVDVVLDTQSYIVSCTSAGKIRETFTKVFKFEGQVGGERAACTLVSVTSAQIDKGLTVAKQSDGTASTPGYFRVSGTAGQFPFTDSVLHDYSSSGTWTLEFSVNGKQIFKTFTVTAVFAGT